MTPEVVEPGRGFPRPLIPAALALLLAGAAWIVSARSPRAVPRGPVSLPNPDAEPPAEFRVGRVRHVVAADAPERLLPDTIFPTNPVRLLWLQGRAAAPLADGGALAPDGAGGVIRFDSTLTQGRRVALGRREIRVGKAVADSATAGQIAVSGDTVYYAAVVRDEIIAFSPSGDTLWVASRELPPTTNTSLALGPDDRLYLLSTPGFSTSAGRLDVFDRFTGHLLRSAALPTALPTVAADREGRVYLLDPFRLLTGVPPADRERFADFALDRLEGGRMTLADLRGKVALINFWASWCLPCRTEMPALDSLRRTVADADFTFLTLDEDVNPKDAAEFVRQLHLDVPVLLGRGRLRERYHYVGLPFTVLLDREGQVVQRWLGFAGPEQIQAEKAVITAELARKLPGATAQKQH